MQEIVKDSIDHGLRTVRVDGHYGTLVMNELYLKIERNVELVRLSSDVMPTTFKISHETMDDITAAWLKFRADQQAFAEAEQARQEEIKTQAYMLAAPHSEIKIKTHGNCWLVGIPALGWDLINPSCTPSDLLEQVKLAVEELENRNKAIIAHVNDIIEAYEEIECHEVDGHWNLHISKLNWDIDIFTPLELGKKIEEARSAIISYHRLNPAK